MNIKINHLKRYIIDYSFFVVINFFNPCEDVYKNQICLHKEGFSGHFDFFNTLENLIVRFDNYSFHSLLYLITYYGFTVNKTLNFWITFKDTELLKNINYYVNREMGIRVFVPLQEIRIIKLTQFKHLNLTNV